jgi:hypothetical protein
VLLVLPSSISFEGAVLLLEVANGVGVYENFTDATVGAWMGSSGVCTRFASGYARAFAAVGITTAAELSLTVTNDPSFSIPDELQNDHEEMIKQHLLTGVHGPTDLDSCLESAGIWSAKKRSLYAAHFAGQGVDTAEQLATVRYPQIMETTAEHTIRNFMRSGLFGPTLLKDFFSAAGLAQGMSACNNRICHLPSFVTSFYQQQIAPINIWRHLNALVSLLRKKRSGTEANSHSI